MCDKYEEIDFLQKRYDIAEYNYELMMEDIEDLWENIILEYLEDSISLGNGFLSKFHKLSDKGYSKFFDFIMKNSNVVKHVKKELKDSREELMRYKMGHNVKIEETEYYNEKIDNLLCDIKEDHIDMICELYPNNGEIVKTVEYIYDNI